MLNNDTSNVLNEHSFWMLPPVNRDYLLELKNFAILIGREASELIEEGFYRRRQIAHKSQRELVTSVDVASERLIRQKIHQKFPDHHIVSEELSPEGSLSEKTVWIIDPLDGTNNFVHGVPFFAVSIAVVIQGCLSIGVIIDPIRNEEFVAVTGKNSELCEQEIVVSDTTDIAEALLATGFPYDISPECENNLDWFVRFSYACQGIRRIGSAALDLAYTACGRFDGFWELKLKPWDMAAGALIVKQAGGTVTDFNGNPWQILSDRIVSANPQIHSQMISIIKHFKTE